QGRGEETDGPVTAGDRARQPGDPAQRGDGPLPRPALQPRGHRRRHRHGDPLLADQGLMAEGGLPVAGSRISVVLFGEEKLSNDPRDAARASKDWSPSRPRFQLSSMNRSTEACSSWTWET